MKRILALGEKELNGIFFLRKNVYLSSSLDSFFLLTLKFPVFDLKKKLPFPLSQSFPCSYPLCTFPFIL